MTLRTLVESHKMYRGYTGTFRLRLSTVADVLDKHADADRVVRVAIPEIAELAGLAEDDARHVLIVMNRDMEVLGVSEGHPMVPGDPEVPAETAAPDGRVGRHAPRNQNEHLSAIMNSKTLRKEVRLLALEAHVRIAWSGLRQHVDDPRFGEHEAELASSYLAETTGLSERKVRDGLKDLDRLGYLTRTNPAKGGKGSTNRTGRYVPTIPNNLREQSHDAR